MEITQTVYVRNRAEWRAWLEEFHDKLKEIWLLYPLKETGMPRVAYSDAVEEALCFGWIDSTQKKYDSQFSAQRYTPRKSKSPWSELNKARARKLIKNGLMMPVGAAKLPNLDEDYVFAEDIIKLLKENPVAWENFQQFPESYKRIRFGYLEDMRKQPDEFRKRLEYFLKMTAENKIFGTIVEE